MSKKVLTLMGLLLDLKGKMGFAHIEPNSAGQFSLRVMLHINLVFSRSEDCAARTA